MIFSRPGGGGGDPSGYRQPPDAHRNPVDEEDRLEICMASWNENCVKGDVILPAASEVTKFNLHTKKKCDISQCLIDRLDGSAQCCFGVRRPDYSPEPACKRTEVRELMFLYV